MFTDLIYETLHQAVVANKIHPILVNFTAALIPVSVGSDILARFLDKRSLRDTAWWTMCFAALLTPFTALAGWLFWTSADDGVTGMTIHKWLGSSIAMLLIGLVAWRWRYFTSDSRPSAYYLLVASAIVGAVIYVGHLGGEQSFPM